MESTTTLTFRVNLVVTMLINFGVNFGLEWATVSNWGRVHKQDFLPMYVTRWSHIQKGGSSTCMALDIPLTSLFLGFFLMLFAASAIEKDIKEHKAQPIESEVYDHWLLKYGTPTLITNVWLRSLVTGIWATIFMGLPTLGLLAAILGNTGSMSAVGYCLFKAFWALLIAIPIFLVAFLNASHKKNYPAQDFEAVMKERANEDAIPVVGNLAKV